MSDGRSSGTRPMERLSARVLRVRAMATTRTATTQWNGSLKEGAGQVTLGSSGLGTYDVTWAARSEEPEGKTSPEELIAAAHSACYSMALSNALAGAGSPPERLETTADVRFQPGEGITGIHITVRGAVPGVDAARFSEFAETAKTNCPVSQALTGTTITLDAALA
jgi:lipoyl-dependent peroxiredoxin